MAERGVIDLGGFDIEGGHGREAGKAHAGRGKLLCKSYNRRPIRSLHSSGICTSRSRGILNSTGGPDGKQADARVRWRMTASGSSGGAVRTPRTKKFREWPTDL